MKTKHSSRDAAVKNQVTTSPFPPPPAYYYYASANTAAAMDRSKPAVEAERSSFLLL